MWSTCIDPHKPSLSLSRSARLRLHQTLDPLQQLQPQQPPQPQLPPPQPAHPGWPGHGALRPRPCAHLEEEEERIGLQTKTLNFTWWFYCDGVSLSFLLLLYLLDFTCWEAPPLLFFFLPLPCWRLLCVSPLLLSQIGAVGPITSSSILNNFLLSFC